jgi:hypothetical protein
MAFLGELVAAYYLWRPPLRARRAVSAPPPQHTCRKTIASRSIPPRCRSSTPPGSAAPSWTGPGGLAAQFGRDAAHAEWFYGFPVGGQGRPEQPHHSRLMSPRRAFGAPRERSGGIRPGGLPRGVALVRASVPLAFVRTFRLRYGASATGLVVPPGAVPERARVGARPDHRELGAVRLPARPGDPGRAGGPAGAYGGLR